MKLLHSFRLLLVPESGPVVHRDFRCTRARRALRAVRKQLVGIKAVHVVKDGQYVRTVDLRRKAS